MSALRKWILLTKSLATNLPATATNFIPSTLVQFIRTVTELSSKGDDLAYDQFCNRARVTEGRVEDRNTVLGSIS